MVTWVFQEIEEKLKKELIDRSEERRVYNIKFKIDLFKKKFLLIKNVFSF